MCQRTYSLPTSKGNIEVTKGTYLTFNKRKQERARSISLSKKIKPMHITSVKKHEQSKKMMLPARKLHPIKAIENRMSTNSSMMNSFLKESGRM